MTRRKSPARWGRMLSQCPRCGEYASGKEHRIQLRSQGYLKTLGVAGAAGAYASHSFFDSTGVHRYRKTCYLGVWDSQWDPLIIKPRVRIVVRGEHIEQRETPASPCSSCSLERFATSKCTHCDALLCDVCGANHLRGPEGRLVALE